MYIQSVNVEDSGEGEESAARNARYQAIIEVAKKQQAAAVLLAHTANDQAETVMMGLSIVCNLE